MKRVDPLVIGRNIIGEGPLWHIKSRKLYWTDIMHNRLYCIDPAGGVSGDWELPCYTACMGETGSGETSYSLQGSDGYSGMRRMRF